MAFTSQMDPLTQKKILLSKFNQAPTRNFQPVNPSSLEGYNMYKNLATMQGPTGYGSQLNAQANFQRGNEMDIASRQNALQRVQDRAGAGSREMAAMQGANTGMASLQGAQQSYGNRLLEALKEDQSLKQRALGKWADLDSKYAQNRSKAALSAYEQDIDKWAAEKQALAQIGYIY